MKMNRTMKNISKHYMKVFAEKISNSKTRVIRMSHIGNQNRWHAIIKPMLMFIIKTVPFKYRMNHSLKCTNLGQFKNWLTG